MRNIGDKIILHFVNPFFLRNILNRSCHANRPVGFSIYYIGFLVHYSHVAIGEHDAVIDAIIILF